MVQANRGTPVKVFMLLIFYKKCYFSRESQLEYKKWELKQVEKSRNVKLSAVDWNDHPDKCLLEMASHRPNYSQFGNA